MSRPKAQRFEPAGYIPKKGETVIAVVVEWNRPERPRLVWNPPHGEVAGFYGELMDEIHVPDDIRRHSQLNQKDIGNVAEHESSMKHCAW